MLIFSQVFDECRIYYQYLTCWFEIHNDDSNNSSAYVVDGATYVYIDSY